jgi:hypothetical protein
VASEPIYAVRPEHRLMGVAAPAESNLALSQPELARGAGRRAQSRHGFSRTTTGRAAQRLLARACRRSRVVVSAESVITVRLSARVARPQCGARATESAVSVFVPKSTCSASGTGTSTNAPRGGSVSTIDCARRCIGTFSVLMIFRDG